MSPFRSLLTLVGLLWIGTTNAAEAPKEVAGDRAPILRLEAGGPCSYVTGLAFSPDGQRLYTTGWDKVVRVWSLNNENRFVLDPNVAFRVPVGPGALGMLNALALSADGNWLAVAGQGPFRGVAGFETKGFILPTLGTFSREMREDWGTIYVFNVRTQEVRVLRGHTGIVLSLTFAPGEADRPLLLSAGRDWSDKKGQGEGALRLWDVKQETSLAVLPGLPEPEFARPGLTAWRTGTGVTQLQVAAAWGDAKLRFWDVAGNALTDDAVSKYTTTVLADSTANRLLTAEYGHQDARLRTWRLAPGKTPKPALLDLAKGADSFPQALAVIAASARVKRSLAATVVRRPPPRAEEKQAYVLQLLALDGDLLGTVKSETALWEGSAKQPVLAVSPTGRHLAVAGNDAHDVLIFNVADLLAKKVTAQKLASVGSVFRSATLVTRGKDTGLLLSEAPRTTVGQAAKEPAAGDLVFDVAQGTLTDDVAGWKSSKVDLTGWHVDSKDTAQGPEIKVVENNQAPRRAIVVKNRQGPRPVLTDLALLPRRGKLPPLLAVATHLSGQPMLSLYDVDTGEPVRQLTGHVDRIYSLAFSADGRFLISSSEDQTVCVWSLTNLPKLLGQLGRLPGVAVARDNDKLVIARVDDDSPFHAKLLKDDIIEGLVEENQFRPLTTSRAFYEAMLRCKPGQEIALRLSNAQGRRDQKVIVGQAIDERKPLLSLFVTRGARAADRQWIGWTPHGPYEASGPRAEQYLGWHFNTGDRRAPTRFAHAGEYRKQYHRDGLLKDLLARGDAAMLPPAPTLPPPKLAALVEADGQPIVADANGHYLIRQPRAVVKLDVLGRTLDTLDAVTWQIGDGAAQRFDLNQPAQRLSLPVPLKPGLQRVRFAAEVPEIGASGDWRELLLRYQPPAPRLEAKASDRRQVVDKPAFTLKAQVQPGLATEPVMVRIVHRNKDKTLFEEAKAHSIDPAKPLALEKDLQLQPGWNRVEITAVNSRALTGFESVETASPLVWEITLFQKAKPPEISLEGVGTESPLRVAVSQFEVRGQIEAKEAIAQAEWERDGEGKSAPLGKLQAGDKKLAFREKITLKPGLQTLRLRTRSVTSDIAERTIAVLFQPLVPSAILITPRPDFVVPGAGESIEVDVQVRLGLPVDLHPFQTFIVRNGQEVKAAVVMNEKTQTLTTRTTLDPGPNRLQVRLRNEWGSVFTSEEVRGRFVRPPRLLALEVPPMTERSLVAATARAHSVVPLRPETVQMQINEGQRRTVEAVLERDPQKKDEWIVKVAQVPLDSEPGPQNLKLWLSNQEAEAPRPVSATVTYRPKQPPPVVELVEPVDPVTHEPRIRVRGRIQSKAPLQSVRLVPGEGKPIIVPAAKLAAIGKDGDVVLDVVLKQGPTELRLEAINEGGEAEAKLTISYLPRPVRLQIDRLVPHGGKELSPTNLADGRRQFPAVPGSRVRMEGSVLWDSVDDERLAKASQVRIFVNGFQQLPTALKTFVPGSRERKFAADLLLTRENNRIDLALPGLPQDAANRVQSQALVVCNAPESQQRTHLLIVSSISQEGSRIEDQFKRALGSTAGALGSVSVPAGEPLITYGPLTGDFVDPVFVYQQLAVIRSRIEGLAHAGASGADVVVFYFQGIEAIDDQGNHHFGGPDMASLRASAGTGVTSDFLAEYFADMPGAQVLLFDVGRSGGAVRKERDKINQWQHAYPDQSRHVAVVRYAWLGNLALQRDSHLITILGSVLPQTTRLLDVTERVQKLVVALPDYGKSLDYIASIDDGLHDVSFSRRRSGGP